MKLANRNRQYVELASHTAYASSYIQNVEKYERVSTLHYLLLSDRVPPMVGSHQSETTIPIPPSLLQNHIFLFMGFTANQHHSVSLCTMCHCAHQDIGEANALYHTARPT